jgi:LPS O-antigen subunit length determinant protein (WzzB/FepE family)
MIDLVNERMRSADIRTAHSSLDYLNREMANANTVELRQAISHLTEEQINNEMMANVQRDYAYHFIDGAVPPEIRTGPKRTWITIGGAVIGLLLGLSYITLRWRLARARSSTLVPDAQGRRSPGAD